MLDVLFERRSVIRPNGDVDELLALLIRNATAHDYDFVQQDEWVTFRITDSSGTCISAHDSLDSSAWKYGSQNGEFVVATQPTTGISSGHSRTFGAHILRRKRAWVGLNDIRFDDPVHLGATDPSIVRTGAARAIVILPERHDGWTISSPEPGTVITTRFAVFDFAYAKPDEWQSIRVMAHAPSDELAILEYDDLMADINIVLGQDIAGQEPDVSGVLERVRRLRHRTVRHCTASLRRGIERDRGMRTEQLRQAIDALHRARPIYFRESAIAGGGHRGVRSRVPADLSPPALTELPKNAFLAAPTIEVFFSYSYKDKELRDELATHLTQLTRAGVIQGWHDGQIEAGEDWERAIHTHLSSAHIVLLLVSADFLASNYCYDVEMMRALARHDAGKAVVIPVIVRQCLWNLTPLAKLQALPKDAKPVTSWPNRDEAWTHVATGVEAAVARLLRS